MDEFGIGPGDRLEGIAVVEAAITECMAERGYEYAPADPNEVLVLPSEVGPGWGMAQSFIDTIDAGESAELEGNVDEDDPILAALPRDQREAYVEARSECSDAAWSARAAREAAVVAQMTVIEQAWIAFRQDPDYQTAAEAWADCMAGKGYVDVDSLDPQRPITTELREHVLANPAPDREWLVDLRDQEVALFQANQECRAGTLDPVEREHQIRILAEFAEEVAAVRGAIRGGG